MGGGGGKGLAHLVTATVPSLTPLEAWEAWEACSGMVNDLLWFDLVWFRLLSNLMFFGCFCFEGLISLGHNMRHSGRGGMWLFMLLLYTLTTYLARIMPHRVTHENW